MAKYEIMNTARDCRIYTIRAMQYIVYIHTTVYVYFCICIHAVLIHSVYFVYSPI